MQPLRDIAAVVRAERVDDSRWVMPRRFTCIATLHGSGAMDIHATRLGVDFTLNAVRFYGPKQSVSMGG